MNRLFTFSLVAAVALAVAMGMGGAIVAAEDTGAENATVTESASSDLHSIMDRTTGENASYQQAEVIEDWAADEYENLSTDEQQAVDAWLAEAPNPADRYPDDYLRQIDSQTHITHWEYTGGEFVVEIHAIDSTTVTMTESADWEEGEGNFRLTTADLEPGNNTVYVDTIADSSEGVAVSFVTPLGQEEQRGTYISTGSEAAEDPFRHFGGHSGLFSGVAMTVLLAALGAVIVIWQEDSGVVKA